MANPWNVVVDRTSRRFPSAAWNNSRTVDLGLAKGEHVFVHYILAKDCADGSQRILDLLIITGRNVKAKLPTARAIITVGKREAFKHTGDYEVQACSALSYQPICSLALHAELVGDFDVKKHGAISARNKVHHHVNRILSKAHDKGLWLVTMGKRRVDFKQENMPHEVRYYRLKHTWRVPAHARPAYEARIKFAKSAKWAFEKVESLRGEIA